MEKTPHIMVIDDESSVTIVLDRILTAEGFKVTVANNGPAALDLLNNVEPDLIMLDIKMPGMDGYQTLEKIRDKYDDVPVIMLTAIPDAASVNKTINLGADDYVRKPFRTAELVARIKVKLRRAGKI
ncbi:MAG: response regulator [Dehalococcoidales bacterium]|nr:response regulator [Dehalococcoidales bacterium]